MKSTASHESRLRLAGRYFSLILSLTFLAGQVQYAYTTYFCTIEHEAVKKPAITDNYSEQHTDNKICDACQGELVVHQLTGVSKPNCLRVERHKKNVVDSFAENERVWSQPFVASLHGPIVNASKASAVRLLSISRGDVSPPSAIPIFNRTLRI